MNEEKSSFDELVAGITPEERSFLLAKLNESKTLLYEITKQQRFYKRYARGRIVRVKFGVNVGSEFSGDHFAIVVSKGDTMKSSTLHIIPITSKKHKKNIKMEERHKGETHEKTSHITLQCLLWGCLCL